MKQIFFIQVSCLSAFFLRYDEEQRTQRRRRLDNSYTEVLDPILLLGYKMVLKDEESSWGR